MTATPKGRHQHWVTINGQRGEDLERVMGTRTFPVESFLPSKGNLPGLGEREIYVLALSALPPETRETLVTYLGWKFGLSKEEQDKEIAAGGIPILATDCTVSSTGMWFL